MLLSLLYFFVNFLEVSTCFVFSCWSSFFYNIVILDFVNNIIKFTNKKNNKRKKISNMLFPQKEKKLNKKKKAKRKMSKWRRRMSKWKKRRLSKQRRRLSKKQKTIKNNHHVFKKISLLNINHQRINNYWIF